MRLTKTTLALLLAPLAIACTPRGIVRTTPPPGKGAIYVYRNAMADDAIVNGNASVMNANNDLVRTFVVRNDRYVVTTVDAGPNKIQVMSKDKTPTTVDLIVPDGGVQYVRCTLKPKMDDSGMLCELVDPQVGQVEVAKGKINEKGD